MSLAGVCVCECVIVVGWMCVWIDGSALPAGQGVEGKVSWLFITRERVSE